MADMEFFVQRPAVVPTIYAYTLPGVRSHEGYIKVGYTDREDVHKRISEQIPHESGLKYNLLFTESAMRSDGSCFTDHDIHTVLKRKGYMTLWDGEDRNEWFKCTESTIKAAIIAVRDGIDNAEERTESFSMRPEQYRAVERTSEYYDRMERDEPTRIPKFLWNAKMRFGKTFAAYQLAKKRGMKRVLVLTFKPAVEDAWRDDLLRHVDFEGWHFVSNKDAKNNALNISSEFARAEAEDKNAPIVVFGSFQDLLGTNETGGIKAKNEFIHATNWDLVIFDEYHFGAWRENAAKLFERPDEEADADFDQEKYAKEEAGNAYNESFLPITTSHYLFLSGTPFRALNSGEFIEEQIYNWTYSDEQKAKANWVGVNNPYASLPRMVMLTYKIPDSIQQIAMQSDFDEFNLNEFFTAEPAVKGKIETARFKYYNEVQKWLDLIRGSFLPSNVDDLKLGMDKRPPMPFSDARLMGVLLHTLWYLPNIASCYAMANLLKEKQNTFYHQFKVNICAGLKAGIGLDALEPVVRSMGDPLQTKTITLTCGKLLTGVTVRPWTGIFMLRNLKSPETYFQAAFRVQSPWVVKDENGNSTVMKEECYVFDFALNRALHQISDYSCRLDANEANPEKKVAEFINFLPVLAYDGSSMKQVNAQDILDITMSGTSATLLARKWQSALLVNVDNITLQRLLDSKEAMDALSRIEAFRTLNHDIQTIINKSNAVKEAKKKGEKPTKEEKKQLSDAEKELKSKRKEVQEKLMKFSTRIPVFMYLTDFRERSVKDIIQQFEPGLFKRVTGLDAQDFNLLCSLGVFNSNLMNEAIFKFKRYEDSSLTYTGIDKHEGKDVGGWDTVLRREEYEKLFYNQQASMDLSFGVASDAPAQEETDAIIVSPTEPVKPVLPVQKPIAKPALSPIPAVEKEEANEYLNVSSDDKVRHKKFGVGTVHTIDKRQKYIQVDFAQGTKKFIFPDAFINGFLKPEGAD